MAMALGMAQIWGLLYAIRKVDKPTNFQPTKTHLNDIFYFSTNHLHDY
jgi:hypothetical protein